MKKIGKKKILGLALLTSLSIFAGTTANNITRTATTTNNTVNDECRPPHKLQKDSNGNLVDENGNIIKEFKRPHVAPAEMEKISLTKKQIESVSTDKMIISMKKGVE